MALGQSLRYQQNNPESYWWINRDQPKTKHDKSRIACIFIGIYCIFNCGVIKSLWSFVVTMGGNRLNLAFKWVIIYTTLWESLSYPPVTVHEDKIARMQRSFVYAPSQWEMTLHCYVVSHWLGAYTKLFLRMSLPPDLFAMMTSSNGNIFRVTGHLCGKFTGHRWISHTKASDAELWCLLWSASEWRVG